MKISNLRKCLSVFVCLILILNMVFSIPTIAQGNEDSTVIQNSEQEATPVQEVAPEQEAEPEQEPPLVQEVTLEQEAILEQLATPEASIAGGEIIAGSQVSLSCGNPGADIYYTLDGTQPSDKSTPYSVDSPITINADSTIKAIALKTGMINSEVMTVAYTVKAATPITDPSAGKVMMDGYTIQTEMPVSNPPAGEVALGAQVTLSSPTAGASIYYTADGTLPTVSSAQYLEPLTINADTIIKAIAAGTGMVNSSVMTANYVLQAPQRASTPTVNPAPGAVNSGSQVRLSTTTAGACIYYTTDGTTPTISSPEYEHPLAIHEATLIKAIAVMNSMINSAVMTAAYTIQAVMPVVDPLIGEKRDVDLTSSTVLGTKGEYDFAGIYEFDNLTIGDNVEITSSGISQMVIRVNGKLTLGKNATIRVRNGYYADAPVQEISDLTVDNMNTLGGYGEGGYVVFRNMFGKGGNGGRGENGTQGMNSIQNLGSGKTWVWPGDGGDGGYGGSGGFGGGNGGVGGSGGGPSLADNPSEGVNRYTMGIVGKFGEGGLDNGAGGGATGLGSPGLNGERAVAGTGGGGNGGAGGKGGSRGGGYGGDGAGGQGGGGGGYGGGILTIIADSISYDVNNPPRFLVSGQQGGTSYYNGENGQGGLLMIECPNYMGDPSHWNLDDQSFGNHIRPSTNGGHGIVTGNPQKVLINSFMRSGGNVSTKLGAGISDVTMTFSLLSGEGNLPAPVVTDQYGQWKQTGFQAGGTYQVTPSKTGYTFEQTTIEFDLENIAMTFTGNSPKVTGRVSTSSGLGTSGIRLTFSLISGSGNVPEPVMSGEDGGWSQSGFDDGSTYQVIAEKPGYIFNPSRLEFAGGSTGLNFTVTPPGFTSFGKVNTKEGAAIPGVKISYTLVSDSGALPEPILTDQEGNWNQMGFEAGKTYRATPEIAGYIIEPVYREFSSSGVTGLDFEGIPTGVSGHVQTGEGIRIYGVTLSFSLVSGSGSVPDPVLTDANGGWKQIGFLPGSLYRVTPSIPGYILDSNYRDFCNGNTGIDFTATLIMASGRIANDSGEGIPGVTLTFSRISGNGVLPDPVQTDDNGGWTLSNLEVGTVYRAIPSLRGYTFNLSYVNFSSGKSGINFAGTSTHASGSVFTVAKQGLTNVTMRFSKVSGSGTVPAPVQTDASGNWEQIGFQPGTVYRVVPTRADYVFDVDYREFGNGSVGINFTGTSIKAYGRIETNGPEELQDVKISFTKITASNSVPLPVQTDSDGTWEQIGFQLGATYRVTPSKLGYCFFPTYQDITDLSLEIKFELCKVQPIRSGETVSANLDNTDGQALKKGSGYRSDKYSFTGTAGQPVAIAVASSDFDAYVYLLDSDGTVVAESSGRDIRIPFGKVFINLPSSGTYIIEITTQSQTINGNYRLVFLTPTSAYGHITSIDGTGIDGVTLTFARADGIQTVPSAVVSNSYGDWSQAGFKEGVTYRVTLSKEGYIFKPTTYSFTSDSGRLDFTGDAHGLVGINPGETKEANLESNDGRSLIKGNDYYADRYSFTGTVGQQVGLALSSSDFNAYVYLIDPSGAVIAESSGQDIKIPTGNAYKSLTTKGTYIIEVTSLYSEADDYNNAYSGNYRLSLLTQASAYGHITSINGIGIDGVILAFSRTDGILTVPSAVVSNSYGDWSQTGFKDGVTYQVTPSKEGYIFKPTTYSLTSASGRLDFTGDAQGLVGINPGETKEGNLESSDGRSLITGNGYYADRYSFTGAVGQQVGLALSSSDFNAYVYLIDPSGVVIAKSSGQDIKIPSGNAFKSLTTKGTYIIEVTSLYSEADDYNEPYSGNYRFSLLTQASAYGHITSINGTGINGVTLAFTRTDGIQTVPSAVVSNSYGDWSQTGFNDGVTYQVTPSKEGYIFKPTTYSFTSASGRLDFTGDAQGFVVINLGETKEGNLESSDGRSLIKGNDYYADRYSFTGAVGQQVGLAVSSSDFDAYVSLIDPSGVVIAKSSGQDIQLPSENDFINLTKKGPYIIEVTSLYSEADYYDAYSGNYQVSLLTPTYASGRLLDGNGNGIRNGKLTFSIVSGTGTLPGPVVSDANGHWNQRGFQDGASYRVTPSLTNTKFYPDYRDFSYGNTVLDFTNFLPVTSGKVTSDNGVALNYVTISFNRLTGGNGSPNAVQTNSSGLWSQSGLEYDKIFRVTPSKVGYVFFPSYRDVAGTTRDLEFTAVPLVAINPGETKTGNLESSDRMSLIKGDDYYADRYSFTGIVGQQVAIGLTGNITDNDDYSRDANVYLIDPTGTVIAAGNGSDLRMPSGSAFQNLTSSGTYIIEVTTDCSSYDFRSGTYRLTLLTQASAYGHITNINGSGIGGVTLTFRRADGVQTVPSAVVSNSYGDWSQAGFEDGVSYQVTPSKVAYIFRPATYSFTSASCRMDFTGDAQGLVAITPGETKEGTLENSDARSLIKGHDYYADRYSFTGSVGQQVAIGLTGSIEDDDDYSRDINVYLIDPTGTVIAAGNGSDLRMPSGNSFQNLPSSGTYIVEVTTDCCSCDFRSGTYRLTLLTQASAYGHMTNINGSGIGGVTLTFTRADGVQRVPSAVVSNSYGDWSQTGFEDGVSYQVTPSKVAYIFKPATYSFTSASGRMDFTGDAQGLLAITLGESKEGTLESSDARSLIKGHDYYADRYSFTGSVGQQVAIGLTGSIEDDDYYSRDAYVYLIDPTGTVIAEGSGNDLRMPSGNALQNLTSSGTYIIEVTTDCSSYDFRSGTYRLTLLTPTYASGSIRDANDVGVGNVTLTFSLVSGMGTVPAPVISDENGHWKQTGFQDGVSYRVTGNKTNYFFYPPYYEFISGSENLNFRCRDDSYSASGKSSTMNGDVIAGVTLTFSRISGNGNIPPSVQTDSNGNWQQVGFEPGTTYRVTPHKENFVFNPVYSDFKGATTSLNFTNTSATASGKITDSTGSASEDSSGVTLTFFRVVGTGNLPNPVISDTSGNWLQASFDDGTTYKVVPSKLGYLFEPAYREFSSQEDQHLDFNCSSTLSRGRVVNSEGNGIPRVTMTFSQGTGEGPVPGPVQTDLKGYWSQFGFTPAVGYRVTPSKPGVTFNFNLREFMGGEKELLDFISTSLIVSGKVTLSQGQGIDGVTLSFTILSGEGNVPEPVQTDSNGQWSQIGFEQGVNYRVIASKKDFVFDLKQFDFTGGGVLIPDMVGKSSCISGKITNLEGTGIGEATLNFEVISGNGRAPDSITTDTNGNWNQAGFQSDVSYRVMPVKEGYIFNPTFRDISGYNSDLNFTANAVQTITMGQQISGTLSASSFRSPSRGDSYYTDTYSFTGTAGQQVAIVLASSDFDAYLYLIDPNRKVIKADDDGGGNGSSRIPSLNGYYSLPSKGSYFIEVTSYGKNQVGNYSLELGSTTSFSSAGRITSISGEGIPSAKLSFSVIAGDGEVPDSVFSDSSGNWNQSGFKTGTTYRVMVSKPSYVFPTDTRDIDTTNTEVNFINVMVNGDKSLLTTAISDATTLLGSKIIGTAVGNVSQEAHDAYNTAIINATEVKNSESVTQAEVDTAVQVLVAATTTFMSAIVKGFSATPLVQIMINPNYGDSAGVFIGLKDIKDANGNGIQGVNLASYQIELDYDHTQAKVFDVIDQGTSNFERLFFVPMALTGTSAKSANVVIKFVSLSDSDMNHIVVPDVTLTFQRGKIVNEASQKPLSTVDAVAGLQYLANLIDDGLDPGQVNVINMASILPPEEEAAGIKPSVKDVIALMQKLVGLRDDSFQISTH